MIAERKYIHFFFVCVDLKRLYVTFVDTFEHIQILYPWYFNKLCDLDNYHFMVVSDSLSFAHEMWYINKFRFIGCKG